MKEEFLPGSPIAQAYFTPAKYTIHIYILIILPNNTIKKNTEPKWLGLSVTSNEKLVLKGTLSEETSWPENVNKKCANISFCNFCTAVLLLFMINRRIFWLWIWTSQGTAMVGQSLPMESSEKGWLTASAFITGNAKLTELWHWQSTPWLISQRRLKILPLQSQINIVTESGKQLL